MAERQAERLLAVHTINSPPVPTRILRGFANVRVDYFRGIPVSGSTHWTGHDWVIVLSADEPTVRQRFSLAHELHHILMHPFRTLVFAPGETRLRPLREVVANHFAACILMPRRFVERAVEQTTDVTILASLFEVSTVAMRRRLTDLDLAEPAGQGPNKVAA